MIAGDGTIREVSGWRRVVPFAIAASLIALVLWRIDHRQFLITINRTNVPLFLAFACTFTVGLLVADCIAGRYVYATLAGPIGLRDLIALRAASYLPGLLNHNIGQAWLTVSIARLCRTTIATVATATMVIYATTFACLLGLGAISLLLAPDRFPWLVVVLAAAGCGGTAYCFVLATRPAWFVNGRMTAPLAQAGVRGHLVALASRTLHVAVLFLGTWLPFSFFDVNIPIADALALLPGLMVLVALPITPQGVGTRDLFAVHVLTVYAVGTAGERETAVAAATLCWAIALTLVQIPLSLIMMRFVSSRLPWHPLPI